MKNSVFLTRTIWIVSLVSLLTDISSEMLYPVMPIYLQSIGFTALSIGILEGFAEALTGLSKGYFGKWSDNIGRRVPFIQAGYLLSAIAKPLFIVSISPLWVFLSRSSDRLGKGIRTASRDALLSDESSPENKGKVFGFHRGMDTVGAAIGPIIALVYLQFYPHHFKELFLIAFLPALAGVFLTLIIREKNKSNHIKSSIPFNPFSYFGYWKSAQLNYKKTIIGLLMFALVNSSDLFLLLRAKSQGISDSGIIMMYIFYNLVYALSSFPAGYLADKISMKTIFIIGMILFSFLYAGFAFAENSMEFYSLFLLYGIFAASTEGVSKAWIAGLSSSSDTGTALGFYGSLNSVAAFVASSMAGLIWLIWSPAATFILSACIALMVAIYFLFAKIKSENIPSE